MIKSFTPNGLAYKVEVTVSDMTVTLRMVSPQGEVVLDMGPAAARGLARVALATAEDRPYGEVERSSGEGYAAESGESRMLLKVGDVLYTIPAEEGMTFMAAELARDLGLAAKEATASAEQYANAYTAARSAALDEARSAVARKRPLR